MIEDQLTALTAAINRLADAMGAKAPAALTTPAPTEEKVEKKSKAAKKEEPAAAEAPPEVAAEPAIDPAKVTMADLRAVAEKLLSLKRLPDILDVNKDHGIRRITECPESKYGEVYLALKKKLDEASAK